MPYKLGERDGQFCVLKDDGSVVKCHPTEEKAKKHLAALKINVEEASQRVEVFSLCVDLFNEDAATRALNGEMIAIMDRVGFYDHWGVWRDVNDGTISEFVENWNRRAERGIRRTRLAVDSDHDGKALGWFKEIAVLPSGELGASFRWNKRGREELQGGSYAYFSPTVYWSLPDHKTGEVVRHQIGGGALTNYPYFGEMTALYDLRGAVSYASVLRKEGDGHSYPSGAYLVVEDEQKVTTWHLRVRSYQGDQLKPDHGLMGAAKAALTSPGGHRGQEYQGPDKEEAIRQLKALYEKEGLKFNEDGGIEMSDQDTAEVKLTAAQRFGLTLLGGVEGLPEGLMATLAAQQGAETVKLQQQLEAFSTRIESLEAALSAEKTNAEVQIGNLTGRLAETELARQRGVFGSLVAQKYSHLPGEQGALADHLLWLSNADTSDDKEHYSFFMELLGAADERFGKQFKEVGVAKPSEYSNPEAEISAKVNAYMEANAGVSYSDAVEAVLRANPGLYESYSNQVAEGTENG